GYLEEGDQIVVRYGDTRKGSPGMRVQTFSEPTFEFKVLVDAFATYRYVELPNSPTISVVAGGPTSYKAILPSKVSVGEPFKLGFKGEDKWGNPSDKIDATFTLSSNLNVENLPSFFTMRHGEFTTRLSNLVVH